MRVVVLVICLPGGRGCINTIFQFPFCITREDLSIDVSITNIGLILTKLGWFHFFSTSRNSVLTFFWKKSGFHAVASTRGRVPFHWCINNYYCRADIDEASAISFLWVLTDRQTDKQIRFWNHHMETCKKIAVEFHLLVWGLTSSGYFSCCPSSLLHRTAAKATSSNTSRILKTKLTLLLGLDICCSN